MSRSTPEPPRREPTRDDDPATLRLEDGRRIAYAEYGRPDGTPLVFLHGTPGSRLLGELLDGSAREAGVRVLAPDRPGYGKSTPWPDRSVADAGEFLAAVLDDAGVTSAGLVAFSGGAPAALATAATHPERVTRVDVVSGATPPGVGPSDPPVQRLLTRMAATAPTVLAGLLRGGAWLAERRASAGVVAQYTDDDRPDPVPDDVERVVEADFVEAFAGGASGAVTEFRNAAGDWGVPFEYVDPDVCFRHGGADRNVPIEGVHELVDRIPGARVEVLPEADHLGALLRSRRAVLECHA